jgi:hypothetical protein
VGDGGAVSLLEGERGESLKRIVRGTIDLEGAAADGVSLVIVFLVAGTQSKLVDEVEGHPHLLLALILGRPVAGVLGSNVVHIQLHPALSLSLSEKS